MQSLPPLPIAFREQMSAILGAEEVEEFFSALSRPPVVSMRYHPRRAALRSVSHATVPWCADGAYLAERPVFTLDPAFHGGAYYVQEASSMAVGWAARQVMDVASPRCVLDLCAAPGGKSTLLTHLGEQHLLVANEVIRSRYPILRENLQRWGTVNKILTNHDVRDFRHLTQTFDLVVVDAPCSGEGLFRKDPRARAIWSTDLVEQCAARQRRILTEAQALVRPDGHLIYCTCTWNTQENEAQIEWLTSTLGWETVKLDFPTEWGIVPTTKPVHAYRFYPHRLRGEGFFLCVLRKPGERKAQFTGRTTRSGHSAVKPLSRNELKTLSDQLTTSEAYRYFSNFRGEISVIEAHWWERMQRIVQPLRRYDIGVVVGQLKRDHLIPDHELAMCTDLNQHLPSVEVDRTSALQYLSKGSFSLPESATGWRIVRYENLPLGWVKILPNRINNYLPKQLRIRMATE